MRECIWDVGARLVRRRRLCKILDSGNEGWIIEAEVSTGIEGSSKRSAIAYLFVRAILGAHGVVEAASLANIPVDLVPRFQG